MNKKISALLPGVKEKVLLKNYTTYKIGGPAKYFFVAGSFEKLALAVKTARELKLPLLVIGGGSNLLVSDKGFEGLVVQVKNNSIRIEDTSVTAGAGADLAALAYGAAGAGLSGLEWSAGVPGTLGGAIYGNAQAFGSKTSEVVESVYAFNIKTLETRKFASEECEFSLKNSLFKKNKEWVVISAVLRLQRGEKNQINTKIKEFLAYRKKNHPLELPSAGSTFVNPEIKIKDKKLVDKYPELKEYNLKGIIPAGFLISRSGLAGFKVGGAQISEKHANFILNLGGAKARDIKKLIKIAQQKVEKIFGIKLESEVQFVGK